MNDDHITLLKSVFTKTGRLITATIDQQMSLSTPCADFTVSKLLAHINQFLSRFAAQATGNEPNEDADYNDLTAAVIEAKGKDPDGEPPYGLMMVEYMVHGWDLATATGQTVEYSDDEVNAGLEFAHTMMQPDFRGEGKPFGPERKAPTDAPLIEQLAAFMGRDTPNSELV